MKASGYNNSQSIRANETHKLNLIHLIHIKPLKNTHTLAFMYKKLIFSHEKLIFSQLSLDLT